MDGVSDSAGDLGQSGGRVVFRAQTPLLHDDLLFRLEIAPVEKGVGHSVGFQLDGYADLLATHGGEIDCVVCRGEGVGASAVFGNDARVFFGTYLRGPFKHHVLQEVREPALPVFLVSRPDAIPHLKGNRRTLMVWYRVGSRNEEDGKS